MSYIYNLIKDDIDKTIKKLLKLKLIVNPKFNEKKHCKHNKISSNKEETGIDKNSTYIRNFLKSFDKNEYIFMFLDNSFVQVNYEFIIPDGEREQVVSKANLTFFPNPGLYSEDIISDLQSISDEQEKEDFYGMYREYSLDFEYSSNYIRLDYDGKPSSFTEFIHPRCHIHIGMHNDFRLGVNKLPLLSDFIDFVLYANYIEKWKEMHSDGVEDLNSYLVSLVNRKEIKKLTEHESVLTEHEQKHYLVNL
ncbi:hypothetical protein CN360_11600 [Bacillus cereus]|uniref:DUF2290 domain-containing protein n=1 Tax=Bacillus cereus TaxID=1396 RepID=UPI000BEDBC0C|nr:DUF2290 domain-containing protein [Bacillus cereus]PEC03195.1 hypothetical protein COM98_20170 [Bacillus cereus]PEV76427.1 hypothetical protein CN437_21945 [Bacillus cereus]PEY93543.1 hypothetical protein CN360_11600 [Bacillus cereus]